jgi:hypothetical protein
MNASVERWTVLLAGLLLGLAAYAWMLKRQLQISSTKAATCAVLVAAVIALVEATVRLLAGSTTRTTREMISTAAIVFVWAVADAMIRRIFLGRS